MMLLGRALVGARHHVAGLTLGLQPKRQDDEEGQEPDDDEKDDG